MIEAMPEILIGDRVYDSDDLDDDLNGKGIQMVSPQRKNRKKPKTQDGRQLLRYKRRWIVERFFAWIKHKRRLLNRWEFYPENFLRFVQISAVLLLLKQF
jgi:transposase